MKTVVEFLPLVGIISMSEKYKFTDPHGMYVVTSNTVGWVDVFTRPEMKQMIIGSLRHCQKEKGLLIHGCVFPIVIRCPATFK